MDEQDKSASNGKKNYGAVLLDTERTYRKMSPERTMSSGKSISIRPSCYRIFSLSIISLLIGLAYVSRRYNPSPTFQQNLRSDDVRPNFDLLETNDHPESFSKLDPVSDIENQRPDFDVSENNDHPEPFSKLDPVADVHLYPFDRPKISRPASLFGKYDRGQVHTKQPLPTNQWYQNMFLLTDGAGDPNENNRVYTIPYVVDTVGPIPGVRLFETKVLGMDKIVQVTYVDFHGLTLGATHSLQEEPKDIVQQVYTLDDDQGSVPLSPLGITLRWKSTNTSNSFQKMTSNIIRGMPYGSMRYQYDETCDSFQGALPTVAAELLTHTPPILDSETQLMCTNKTQEGREELVRKSVQLSFKESDYTWLVFYSHPVFVRCYEDKTSSTERFSLQVVRLAVPNTSHNNQDVNFVSRIAIMNNCTHGTSPYHCTGGKPYDKSDFSSLLHKHANVYPGPNTKIDFTFLSDEGESGRKYSYLNFDWDARHISDNSKYSANDGGLLMYALSHHRESFSTTPDDKKSCVPSLSGQACLTEGSNWILKDDLAEQPSFSAPRPPMAEFIPNLAKAINEDIHYRVPEYFRVGAGDTYFSGKNLAKLARILLITEEVTNMCSEIDDEGNKAYKECNNITLPSNEDFDQAFDHLRSSTEIWINGTAVTPFVYDEQWGGLVSCGCYFNGTSQRCDNVFPDCPSFYDRGLDFGHGFYNDHHFHQGYHIYAAAAVAHFDPSWGTSHFEEVLLLIRDIANPSPDDVYFPTFRMKDWYLGNSWAGGIGALYPNGRNQESSGEAIAAYEAISLFGQVMTEAWNQVQNISNSSQYEKISRASHIRDIGRLLTATELRAADTYWHVSHLDKRERVYPLEYTPFVVGMLWNMMAQFQTWFGSAPHLAYGIQLIPLTPVSERRDKIDWAKELYPSFANSCRSSSGCDAEGWGIAQNAILATVGHPAQSVQYAEKLPKEVFESAGGNGHSLTNTIWYYTTRPKTDPLELAPELNNHTLDCGCPETCTAAVLDSPAVGYTCGVRVEWLIENDGKSLSEACAQVAGNEFADVCNGCNPEQCAVPEAPEVPEVPDESQQCPKCSREICEDEKLNKCPVHDAPFLCVDGPSRGGCSMVPWVLKPKFCNKCCKLTYKCK